MKVKLSRGQWEQMGKKAGWITAEYGTDELYQSAHHELLHIGRELKTAGERIMKLVDLTDDIDDPLPNAQVYLTWANGTKETYPRYTSSNGFINLTDVPLGDYSFHLFSLPHSLQAHGAQVTMFGMALLPFTPWAPSGRPRPTYRNDGSLR